MRVQYDFKELELEPTPAEKPKLKEKKPMERKLSIRPAVVSVAEQRELLLQGSRNKTPHRDTPSSRLSGFSRLSSGKGRMSNLRGSAAARPSSDFKIGSLGGSSRNGFATFYRGSRELKPTPMRSRPNELEDQGQIQRREKAKIRVSV